MSPYSIHFIFFMFEKKVFGKYVSIDMNFRFCAFFNSNGELFTYSFCYFYEK